MEEKNQLVINYINNIRNSFEKKWAFWKLQN